MSLMWSQFSLNNWTAERKVRIISKNLGADTEHWANVRWGTNTPWVIPMIKDGEALISYSCCCHSLQKHPHSVLWRSRTHRTLCCFAVSSRHLSREGCWILHSLSWRSNYSHGENWWALQTQDGFTSWETRKYAPYTYALAPFLLGWLIVSYPYFW